MPVAAESTRLAHILEAVRGQTPTTPAFELWRTTGETLAFAPETSESGEFGGVTRSQSPDNVTGVSISGDISFKLSKFTALEEAMAAVLAGEWGECPLTGVPGGAIDSTARVPIGDELKTFTIEKQFPNPNYVDGAYDGTCVPTGAPGASVVLTFSGTYPNAGSGVMVLDFVIDTTTNRRVIISVPANTADAIAVGALATTELLADGKFTATDNLDGSVTVGLASGTQIDSVGVRSGADSHFYQRYRGCTYSVLSIDVAPAEDVEGSVTIVSGVPELDGLPIAGATYTSAGASPIFTAPQVVAISMGDLFSIGTHCWSSLNISLDSQNRGIQCIGTAGEREVVLGQLAATISGDVYFTDQEVLEAVLKNQTVGDGYITLTNADGELYRFDLFDLKPTSATLSAGAKGDDLTIPVEFQPTPAVICDDGGGNDWESSVILSTVDSKPPLP